MTRPGLAGAGPAALEVSGLAKSFGSLRLFEGLEFHCGAGECLSVTGPNGAGKSTLLRILAGLEPADRGSATWRLGADELHPREARRLLGMAAPDHALYGELTAVENLRFHATLRGIRLGRDRFEALLEEVGLGGRGGDRAEAFSSGMRQRLSLAAAVLHDPRFLLLDEPGAHLDAEGRRVLRVLVDARLERGTLVVIATNDPEEMPHGSRTVWLGGALPGSRR